MNEQVKPTNGLGIAGFILSLVGLCGTGGFLIALGLIMSLIALKDEPRGFAIAGVVIGALGSCGIILTLLIAPFVILTVLLGLGATGAALGLAAIVGGAELESQIEMAILDAAIQEHVEDRGSLPASLDDLRSFMGSDAPAGLFTDHWANPYEYELTEGDGPGYRLYSAGADGIAGNADDVTYDGDLSFGGSGWDVDTDVQTDAPAQEEAPDAPSEEAPETPEPPAGGEPQ